MRIGKAVIRCIGLLCGLVLLLAGCDLNKPVAPLPLLAPGPQPEPVEDGAFFACFDDGFESWDWAVDILDSLEMKGNFFVHSRWLYLNQAGMDWWDAIRYDSLGHSVLSHARNNTPIPPDSIDIYSGYQNIEGRDMDTTCFAYPNGYRDSATIAVVSLYHQVARLCTTGLVLTDHFEAGNYEIVAVQVMADVPIQYYKNLLSQAKADGKVVILVWHKFCDEPDCGVNWETYIGNFREIVEHADAIGIRAWTFAEYLDR